MQNPPWDTFTATGIDCDRPDIGHLGSAPAAVGASLGSCPWMSPIPRWTDLFGVNASSSYLVRYPNHRHGLHSGADDEHVRHRQPS